MINFSVGERTHRLIDLIAERVYRLTGGDKITTTMDLIAAHKCRSNGLTVNALKVLERADDNLLLHDTRGINRHVDHDTGELQECFLPKSVSIAT